MSAQDLSGLRPLDAEDLQPSKNKPQAQNASANDSVTLRRVQRIAKLMDSSMSIPGTSIRFGLDSALGLIPGVGDIGTAAVSSWILLQARRSGMPKRRLARMAANIVIDLAVGAVPIAGDLFDVYWKSNLRNARLLEDHLLKKVGSTGVER
ncbi:hypothetical protein CKO51_18795 [Rhodopirellula sp. SM50]|nr:DUF4112 domain-containing protein [Rhodopirellula sp. SM50]PAY18043.1 hypothetical protein CKO51_18795 [Rhodopirellula sp. SM50]